MVRRGSTVRVRQRALQKPRITGPFGMCSVGPRPDKGVDGAVYGAFASRTRCIRPPPPRPAIPPAIIREVERPADITIRPWRARDRDAVSHLLKLLSED